MRIDAISEAAIFSSFVALMQFQKASVLAVANLSCVWDTESVAAF